MEKENTNEILQEFVFGLWRLWKNRNDVVFNGVNRQPLEILEVWKKNLYEYRDAKKQEIIAGCSKVVSSTSEPAGKVKQWSKPGYGWIKINTDATWCKDSKRAGVGWVAHDFASLLQVAGGTGTLICHSAAAAEAEAIHEALESCTKLGVDIVTIESDAKSIIYMIRKELTWDYSLECILGDIEILERGLRAVSFEFVSRECNHADHSVAKFVFKARENFLWDCIRPEFLFNILAQDINLSIRI